MSKRKAEPQNAGPYDADECFFCGKSAEDGPEHTAGYQRREEYAQQGEWKDACEGCARKEYKQPKQFQQGDANATA